MKLNEFEVAPRPDNYVDDGGGGHPNTLHAQVTFPCILHRKKDYTQTEALRKR